jgi:hypothetical protein
MFKTRSVSLAGFCFSWHESRLMQLPPTDQLTPDERPVAAKTPTRFWIISASVVMHAVIVILLLVPLPMPSLNAPQEEEVSLELIVEPEPPPPEDSQEQEEPPQEAQPEEPAPPEPPAEEAEEAKSEPPLSILPDIAIRPEESRLDAVDSDGQKPAQEEEQPAEPSPEPAPVDEPTAEPSTEDLAATSEEGELPAGEVPPLPLEKPEVSSDGDQQEEREPLSASAIEGSGLRQMMGELPPNRRLTQICSIEVLAQVRATNADYARVVGLIPFSDQGGLITGSKLTATGGAFNLGGSWVEVDFTCEVDLERYRVTRFSQNIGRALSRAEATERGFTRYE